MICYQDLMPFSQSTINQGQARDGRGMSYYTVYKTEVSMCGNEKQIELHSFKRNIHKQKLKKNSSCEAARS